MRGISALLVLLPVGCIDTDSAVFVEASVADAAATVEQSALATAISGTFSIKLHLGTRASGPSEVPLLGVTVSDANQTGIADLEVTTDPAFPVTVPVSSDIVVGAAFAADDNQFETTMIDLLCAPAGIQIVAVFEDPLRGGSINASSGIFHPSGCP